MARIRTIKPDFWDSPATGQASLRARLLFIAMWNWADDFGIGDAHSGRLWNFAFPNDEPPKMVVSGEPADIPPTFRRIPAEYAEVSNLFGVIFFEHDGRPYYYIPTWNKHQKIDRRSVQKVPYPDEDTQALFVDITGPPKSQRNPPTSQRNVGVGTEELGTEELGTTLTGGGASHEAPAPTSRRKPRRPIPDGWQPKSRHATYCQAQNIDLTHEAEKFRSNALAKDVRFADWDQGFDNWLKKSVEFRSRDSQRRPQHSTTDDRVNGWLQMSQNLASQNQDRLEIEQ